MLILAAEDSRVQLRSGLDFSLLTLELQTTNQGQIIDSDVCIHLVAG